MQIERWQQAWEELVAAETRLEAALQSSSDPSSDPFVRWAVIDLDSKRAVFARLDAVLEEKNRLGRNCRIKAMLGVCGGIAMCFSSLILGDWLMFLPGGVAVIWGYFQDFRSTAYFEGRRAINT